MHNNNYDIYVCIYIIRRDAVQQGGSRRRENMVGVNRTLTWCMYVCMLHTYIHTYIMYNGIHTYIMYNTYIHTYIHNV